MTIPTDSYVRKAMPLATGCYDYFPQALEYLSKTKVDNIYPVNIVSSWLVLGNPEDLEQAALACVVGLQKLQELLTGCPTLDRHEPGDMLDMLQLYDVALMEVARLSKHGNDKHNPGDPLHWSRGKSNDHRDTIARHLLQYAEMDDDTFLHAAKMVWRLLAYLQILIEQKLNLPPSRGSRE